MTGEEEDWARRMVHPRLGEVTVIQGVVRVDTPHCDECGGEMPPGSEAFLLLSRADKSSELHCGSCFRDED